MKYILSLLSLVLFGGVFAQETDLLDLSRYKYSTNFVVEGITTPKVVRFQLDEPLEGNILLLEEDGDMQYDTSDVIPFRTIKSYEKITKDLSPTVTQVSSSFQGKRSSLVDKNPATTFTFDSQDKNHIAEISFPKEVSIASVRVLLDEGVIAPEYVSVDGLFGNGEWRPIVGRKYYHWNISWPEVSVQKLRFTFENRHLFRVKEIQFLGQEAMNQYDELVFFAEEGKQYRLFTGASFGQKSYRAQYLPLNTDSRTPLFEMKKKSDYEGFNPDYDRDGIMDTNDLCPKIYDEMNADIDKNGRGDVCEDPDQDGRMSLKDNCPFKYNPNQADQDADGKGDVCDMEANHLIDNIDYLLYGVFGLVVLGLGTVMWRSFHTKS